MFWGRWWWTGACISLPPGVAPLHQAPASALPSERASPSPCVVLTVHATQGLSVVPVWYWLWLACFVHLIAQHPKRHIDNLSLSLSACPLLLHLAQDRVLYLVVSGQLHPHSDHLRAVSAFHSCASPPIRNPPATCLHNPIQTWTPTTFPSHRRSKASPLTMQSTQSRKFWPRSGAFGRMKILTNPPSAVSST